MANLQLSDMPLNRDRMTAKMYHQLGMNVVPLRQGTKSPLFSWEKWQYTQQNWEQDLYHQQWEGNLAAINGIGRWHSIDVDHVKSFHEAIPGILFSLGLPLNYPWIVQTGSGEGFHIWYQSYQEEEQSLSGVLVGRAKEEGTFRQLEVRWDRSLTTLPPTTLPGKYSYRWYSKEVSRIPSTPPACLSVETILHMMHVHCIVEEKKPISLHQRGEDFELQPSTTLHQRYAQKAVKNEITLLSQTREGGRQTQLNKSAFALGQLIGAGHLDEVVVKDQLFFVAEEIGLSTSEIESTINKAIEDGMRCPRMVTLVEPKTEAVAIAPMPLDATLPNLLSYSADDTGNAETLYALSGKMFLYCEAYGWMYWTRRHWEREGGEYVLEASIIQALRKRRQQAEDKDNEAVIRCTKADMKIINGCKNAFKHMVYASVDSFDAEKDLLNCKNGTLDLRTGALTQHNPLQRFTYCLRVGYDPDKDYSAWDAYLQSVVGGGQEMLDFLQTAVGYSLTGHTKEECMFYVVGPTRSGKGTFAEVLLCLLPTPLSNTTSFQTFIVKREGDTSNFDLAPLKPARFIVASEGPRHQQLDSAKVKQITGGDRVSCAFKHKDHFSYLPQYKIWLLSNFNVNADPDDTAMWGRIRIIEFPHSFFGNEDRSIKESMRSEEMLQAVLAWSVEGAKAWYALGSRGLLIPESMKKKTNEHRGEVDMVGQWIEEHTVAEENAWTSNQDIMESYMAWCKNNNMDGRGAKGLTDSLKAKGYTCLKKYNAKNKKTVRGIQGMHLIEENVSEIS